MEAAALDGHASFCYNVEWNFCEDGPRLEDVPAALMRRNDANEN